MNSLTDRIFVKNYYTIIKYSCIFFFIPLVLFHNDIAFYVKFYSNYLLKLHLLSVSRQFYLIIIMKSFMILLCSTNALFAIINNDHWTFIAQDICCQSTICKSKEEIAYKILKTLEIREHLAAFGLYGASSLHFKTIISTWFFKRIIYYAVN